MSDSYTVAEVAGMYAVGEKAVRRWIRDGKLEGIRTPGGREYRIPAAAIPAEMRPQPIYHMNPEDVVTFPPVASTPDTSTTAEGNHDGTDQ